MDEQRTQRPAPEGGEGLRIVGAEEASRRSAGTRRAAGSGGSGAAPRPGSSWVDDTGSFAVPPAAGSPVAAVPPLGSADDAADGEDMTDSDWLSYDEQDEYGEYGEDRVDEEPGPHAAVTPIAGRFADHRQTSGDDADGPWGDDDWVDDGELEATATTASTGRAGFAGSPDTAGTAGTADGGEWDDEEWAEEDDGSAYAAAGEAEPTTGPHQLPHWSHPPADSDDDDSTSAWSAYAAQGPRWRDQPGDWNDVDFDDAGVLAGAEDVRVGALDPDRPSAAAYAFEDEELNEPVRRGRGGRGGRSARDSGGARARREAERAARRAEAAAEREAAAPATAGAGSPGATARRTRPAAPDRTAGRPARPTAGGDGTAVRSRGDRGRDVPTAVGVGVVLGAATLIVFLALKERGAAGLVAVALTLAVLEFFNALRHRGFQPATLVALVGTPVLAGAAYWRGTDGITIGLVLIGLVTMLWYLVGVVRERPVVNIAVTLLGIVYVGGLGSFANVILRTPSGDGIPILLGAIVGTVAYDVVGFLVGSRIGRVPLAPEISPNKTIEGLAAGMVGSVVVCAIVFGAFGVEPWNLKKAILLGVVVGIAAPLGDLCESMLKRDLGVKDMGSLLPEHGGVLDRIDAMLFVVPAVFFLARLLDWV